MRAQGLPSNARVFSAEELSAFADEHITYEVTMLAHLATLWTTTPAWAGPVANSAFLVSTLVHLRLLDDFLGRGDRRIADISPEGELKGGERLTTSSRSTTCHLGGRLGLFREMIAAQ